MRKTIVTLTVAIAATLLTGCEPGEMGIHPETRSVVKKGNDESGLFIVCRSSWTNSNGPQHKDQRKEVSARTYDKTQIGDSC